MIMFLSDKNIKNIPQRQTDKNITSVPRSAKSTVVRDFIFHLTIKKDKFYGHEFIVYT